MTVGGTGFGDYLRSLRKGNGLSLKEVATIAKEAGFTLDKGTLSRFERGQQRLSLQALVSLSRIYGVRYETIMRHYEEDQPRKEGT